MVTDDRQTTKTWTDRWIDRQNRPNINTQVKTTTKRFIKDLFMFMSLSFDPFVLFCFVQFSHLKKWGQKNSIKHLKWIWKRDGSCTRIENDEKLTFVTDIAFRAWRLDPGDDPQLTAPPDKPTLISKGDSFTAGSELHFTLGGFVFLNISLTVFVSKMHKL